MRCCAVLRCAVLCCLPRYPIICAEALLLRNCLAQSFFLSFAGCFCLRYVTKVRLCPSEGLQIKNAAARNNYIGRLESYCLGMSVVLTGVAGLLAIYQESDKTM